MIGWSRRNTESSRRRTAWWASLTEEEKALETRREAVADRWFYRVVWAIALYIVVLWVAIPLDWANRHMRAYMALWLLAHPGGLIIGAFWAIHKKRQVK
jgi:hypothetical protein